MERHPAHIAVIEIGTNTSKCLIARLQRGRDFEPVALLVETTRIGTGVGVDGVIRSEAVDRTCRAIGAFQRGYETFADCMSFMFSTHALRVAANASDVVAQIERRTGIRPRILTGEEEARFAYLSTKRSLRPKKPLAALVDIGGGSTELVVARRGHIAHARSYPLGALGLTERFVQSDPIAERDFAGLVGRVDGVVRGALKDAALDTVRPGLLDLIVSGGTIATSTAMLSHLTPNRDSPRDPRRTAPAIKRGDLARLLSRCLALPLSERKRLPGIEPERADIMPAGLAIALAWMQHTGKRVVFPNLDGVREGAAAHLVANNFMW